MHTHIITTPTGTTTQAARNIDVTTTASAPASARHSAEAEAAAEDVAVASECAAATFAQRFSFSSMRSPSMATS